MGGAGKLLVGNIRRMVNVLDLYGQVTRLPAGKRIFSVLFSQKAPYFGTVRPRSVHVRIISR